MSVARETEARRRAHVEASLAKAEGAEEAARLMRVAAEHEARLARQPVEPEPLALKVRRPRRTPQGRERLRRAKTFSDVEFV